MARLAVLGLALAAGSAISAAQAERNVMHNFDGGEQQITRERHGHILTNSRVWSPDSEWIVFDTRSDPAGEKFDGTTIKLVHVRSGQVRTIYQSRNGARCGVATFHPRQSKVVFILGPEHPSANWTYGATRRQGVIVDIAHPGIAMNLDACDLTSPFTPGALRGGSHVHVWDSAGERVSFTYEDEILNGRKPAPNADVNLRNVGVSVPVKPVLVHRDHPRNHDGEYFSVLVTRTTADPKPGTDEIKRAFEEAWLGTNGYLKKDGVRVPHALAFQGHVVTARGNTISEVFLTDVPVDITKAGHGPLQGTDARMPFPPEGTAQRRLTFTAERKYPGLQGPRHWLQSSPDGSRIAFLMKDDEGVVQLWTISPNGGAPVQLTRNPWPVASAFTWSPNGMHIACVVDGSIGLVNSATGETTRLTERVRNDHALRPEACVFSPTGKMIAFVKNVDGCNQIFVVKCPK